MSYDSNYWNKYTDDNETSYNEEFAKFILDLVVSLKANSVLEVGCNTGNALRKFPSDFDGHGIDLNEKALKLATEKLSTFKFQKGAVTEIPHSDSSIDFVFTHNVLNYVPENDMSKSVNELFRVSKKYILNCELYNENESQINESVSISWHRNMYKRWLDFPVKIISNVDMHEDIDPKKTRFVLVKKIS